MMLERKYIVAVITTLVAVFCSITIYTHNTINTAMQQQQQKASQLHKSFFATNTDMNLKDTARRLGIRLWGCKARNETPLIFLHIGKSSGGRVRARLASSSLNYTAGSNWKTGDMNNAYYPVQDKNGNIHRGTFCSSAFFGHGVNALPTTPGSYPSIRCSASTPLGHAIACPIPTALIDNVDNCYPRPDATHMNKIYPGHNRLGAELHWLPVAYLQEWWMDKWAPPTAPNSTDSVQNDEVSLLWKSLLGDNIWCAANNRSRPVLEEEYYRDYSICSLPMQELADHAAIKTVSRQLGILNGTISSWAPVYASLPLLRITIVREPFSWLLSKFFWHRSTNKLNLTCDDMTSAAYDRQSDIGQYPVFRTMSDVDKGWATQMALGHILLLCGEDCEVRNAQSTASLAQLEQQAIENLRQSFSVVGLMNDQDVFFDMVSARVDYVDMKLNPDVVGEAHATRARREESHCRALYEDRAFQLDLMSRSPAIASLVRLYKAAVEVNRVQLLEMTNCGIDIG